MTGSPCADSSVGRVAAAVPSMHLGIGAQYGPERAPLVVCARLARPGDTTMTQTTAHPLTDVTIRSAAPTFLVSDIATTIDWYVANLGF